MEMVYQYMTGPRFRQRVQAIVESALAYVIRAIAGARPGAHRPRASVPRDGLEDGRTMNRLKVVIPLRTSARETS